MNNPKILIIGAGSHFTLGLFGDFFRVNDLWGSELVLMDIDEERLGVITKVIQRIVKSRKVDLRIDATTNLDEALENADFIILTIRSGGLEALKEIIEIPLQLGVVEVVGDTVGPSGILKGLLEIPVIAEIARKIRDTAPDALV
ncbi:TPA: alpha-glucosidase/alpha-galactosidase, partial [Candidatus Bathyarchaeota archaeon]|nr:alpha-glucosidase/alpha-galactosidase [Candidatus Bathyarchaeota archaeon]